MALVDTVGTPDAPFTVSAKAQRLLEQGRVHVGGPAMIFYVDGDTPGRPHRVVLGEDGTRSCPCLSTREFCSHVETAELLAAGLRAQASAVDGRWDAADVARELAGGTRPQPEIFPIPTAV